MRFLLRNWHLKLAAVLVATILYTGLVFSGTLTERTVLVPITADNQPDGSYNLTGDLGFVEVRYRASTEAGAALPAEAFSARVDLSQYDMEQAPQQQELEVLVSADGVQILDRVPATVRVRLDHLETRTVPIEVETGEIPDGLEIGDPELSDRDAEVEGPASAVARVDRAQATILIDPSGIDFDQPVELVPVDIEGQPVDFAEISPEVISVRIDVEEVETTTTVPVRPDITGTPAPGYALEALSVEPSTVTLRGLPEELRDVTEVVTEPLDIGGASESQTLEAQLILPPGTELARSGAEAVVTVEATIGLSVGSRSFVVGVLCVGAGQNGCQPALQQLTLTLSGPSGVLSGLTAEDLTPVLDVTGLAPGTYNVTPELPAFPAGVELLQLTPNLVTVRVVAPAPAPTPTPAP